MAMTALHPEPIDTRRVRPVEPTSEWTLAADLGQTVDPTALAVVERRTEPTGEWSITPSKVSIEKPRVRLVLRYIERIPLRTRYQDVVNYVAGLLATPPLDRGATLLIDQTGARAAGDMFRGAGLNPVAVTLTGGDQEHQEGREFRVPKTHLVNKLDALLNAGELTIAHDLRELDAFEGELRDFQRRITGTGHVTFAAKEGSHDDLVIAVAIAAWWSSRPRFQRRVVRVLGL